jgi:hypothetical protein
MKIKEVNAIEGDSKNRGFQILRVILDIPLDDCAESNFVAIADKMNELCSIEDNGEIILRSAQDTVQASVAASNPRSHSQLTALIMQMFITYGFVIGYYYRQTEERNDRSK